MKIESIFGSQEALNEAALNARKVEQAEKEAPLKPLEMPKVENSVPSEMEAVKPVEMPPSSRVSAPDIDLKKGETYFAPDDAPASEAPAKRKIGFGTPDVAAKAEPTPAEEAPKVEPTPAAEAPKVEPTPVPETPVANVNEKSMFGQKEAGRKVNFLEMAELSEGDYDLLVEDLQEKVDNVKKLGNNVLKWSGLKLAGRASKATAEGLVKSAVFARRVSEYGWWRFGKEASVDATKYAAKKIVEKGAKAAWGWVSKKEGVMNFINEQIEKAQKEAQEKKDKLAATVKQLEELKAKGIISNFKLKVPLNG